MLEFTIRRNEWLRGDDDEASCLFRPTDGKRCCMGFYMNALGLSDEAIKNTDFPSQLGVLFPEKARWLKEDSTKSPQSNEVLLSCINDLTTVIEENEREEKIKEVFAEHGITVNFED